MIRRLLSTNKGASGSPLGPKNVVFGPHPKASRPLAARAPISPVASESSLSFGAVRGVGGQLTCLILLSLAPATAQAREVVLTFGGDVCANRSRVQPEAGGTRIGSSLVPWSAWTRHMARLLDGHINFINLETVLNDAPLKGAGKKYTFLTHPNALRHLTRLGVNLVSLANNHAYDYGGQGALATLRHVQTVAAENKGRLWFAGLGRNENEAGRVVRFKVRGHTFAFAAMGNLTNMNMRHRAGRRKPGTLGVRVKADYEQVLSHLAKVKADYKIFSVHLGVERRVQLDPGQRAKYERALTDAGVDLVLGHHPHVVRPVQRKGHKLIFYSLGNYMMRGARDMWPLPDAQDYGLFGRLHLNFDVRLGRLVPTALEVVPLTDMHNIPRPLGGAEGQRRVRVLNRLSSAELGDEALRFRIRNDGTGVACFPGEAGPRAQRVCGRAQSAHERREGGMKSE